MPDSETLIAPLQFKNLDAIAPKQRQQRNVTGMPLVEFKITLINRFGEERKIFGLVPEGMDRVDAAKLVIEQYGNDCATERGKYDQVNKIDLSDFTWIKRIALSDGFTMEDWIQIRDRNGEFEIGELAGKSWWENGNTKRVSRGDNEIVLTEDFGMSRELPATKDLINGKERACGGCGGTVTQKELDLAKLAAKFDIKRESYAVNLDTGEVRRTREDRTKEREFVFKPETVLPVYDVGRFDAIERIAERMPCEIPALPLAFIPSQLNEISHVPPTTPANAEKEAEKIEELKITATERQEAPQAAQPIGEARQYAADRIEPAKADITREESMLMRLLLNPVERRLYGKLYGLPAGDEANAGNDIETRETRQQAAKEERTELPSSSSNFQYKEKTEAPQTIESPRPERKKKKKKWSEPRRQEEKSAVIRSKCSERKTKIRQEKPEKEATGLNRNKIFAEALVKKQKQTKKAEKPKKPISEMKRDSKKTEEKKKTKMARTKMQDAGVPGNRISNTGTKQTGADKEKPKKEKKSAEEERVIIFTRKRIVAHLLAESINRAFNGRKARAEN